MTEEIQQMFANAKTLWELPPEERRKFEEEMEREYPEFSCEVTQFGLCMWGREVYVTKPVDQGENNE